MSATTRSSTSLCANVDCESEFAPTSLAHIYCSANCRAKALWAKRRDGESWEAETRACAWCGEPFTQTAPVQLLCSDDCRTAKERDRWTRKERTKDVDSLIRQRERLTDWGKANRGHTGTNAWNCSAPPYGTHLPGVAVPIMVDPLPKFPIDMRNTGALHGALHALLSEASGHIESRRNYALMPTRPLIAQTHSIVPTEARFPWGVYWLHPNGERLTNASFSGALFDVPTTFFFGHRIRLKAPVVKGRGRQRMRIEAITPVVIQTDGRKTTCTTPRAINIESALGGEFTRLLAPSKAWEDFVSRRICVEIVDQATQVAHVPMNGKYGDITGWVGSVDIDANPIAAWLLRCAERIGFGGRIGFGFGRIKVTEFP